MNEAKYTKGPWGIPDSARGRISKIGVNGGWDGLIATADCGDYARSRAEGIANARLISAAPDLLEALQEIEDVASFIPIEDRRERRQLGEALDKARAAIAKALGN